MKNDRLELLSDMVRKGEPIGFFEALEVIEYQEQLKLERSRESFLTKLKRMIGLIR